MNVLPCNFQTSKLLLELLGSRGKKDTSEKVRKQIYQSLLAKSKNRVLGKQVIKQVTPIFGLSIRIVQKIWHRRKKDLAQGNVVNVACRKRGRVGRKVIPIDFERLCGIPLSRRMTIEDVAKWLRCSKSKVIRYMRKGLIRRHHNKIKSFLTPANKKSRLQWYLDMLDPASTFDDPHFKDLFDHVFIDDKCFFYTKIIQVLLATR
ncbi:hypothetical protein PR202_gb17656 [Eleusine coracana subsp. coracana]|uniref:DUF7769 domain-containing protein n=1 Tax=Eleusine coracana subsp. coracana TaxID=191504 RepID=A0AAV5F519_ELECO|nr:hypothetical protein PR202_gb17656 [Eleusine coracana subsp. coracana]